MQAYWDVYDVQKKISRWLVYKWITVLHLTIPHLYLYNPMLLPTAELCSLPLFDDFFRLTFLRLKKNIG